MGKENILAYLWQFGLFFLCSSNCPKQVLNIRFIDSCVQWSLVLYLWGRELKKLYFLLFSVCQKNKLLIWKQGCNVCLKRITTYILDDFSDLNFMLHNKSYIKLWQPIKNDPWGIFISLTKVPNSADEKWHNCRK